MTRILIALAAAASLTACVESTNRDLATGAAAGAVLGAVVNDEDRLKGAAIGAAVGAASVEVVNRVSGTNDCIYTNTSTGERWRAPCSS